MVADFGRLISALKYRINISPILVNKVAVTDHQTWPILAVKTITSSVLSIYLYLKGSVHLDFGVSLHL
jgi:hypothetical protein